MNFTILVHYLKYTTKEIIFSLFSEKNPYFISICVQVLHLRAFRISSGGGGGGGRGNFFFAICRSYALYT